MLQSAGGEFTGDQVIGRLTKSLLFPATFFRSGVLPTALRVRQSIWSTFSPLRRIYHRNYGSARGNGELVPISRRASTRVRISICSFYATRFCVSRWITSKRISALISFRCSFYAQNALSKHCRNGVDYSHRKLPAGVISCPLLVLLSRMHIGIFSLAAPVRVM